MFTFKKQDVLYVIKSMNQEMIIELMILAWVVMDMSKYMITQFTMMLNMAHIQ